MAPRTKKAPAKKTAKKEKVVAPKAEAAHGGEPVAPPPVQVDDSKLPHTNGTKLADGWRVIQKEGWPDQFKGPGGIYREALEWEPADLIVDRASGKPVRLGLIEKIGARPTAPGKGKSGGKGRKAKAPRQTPQIGEPVARSKRKVATDEQLLPIIQKTVAANGGVVVPGQLRRAVLAAGYQGSWNRCVDIYERAKKNGGKLPPEKKDAKK